MYAFLHDEFNRLYLAGQRTGRVFTVFSLLSLFIAGIGIFGLIAAATEQRSKEQGIRRVLGPLHPLLFIVAPLCTIFLATLIEGAKVSGPRASILPGRFGSIIRSGFKTTIFFTTVQDRAGQYRIVLKFNMSTLYTILPTE